MAEKNVLVLFASRYGSTREIARRVSEVLEEEGLAPTLVDLQASKTAQWPAPAPYAGVLVGSGIKVGRWRKEARKYVEAHRDVLNEDARAVGLFVSCAMVMSDPEGARAKYLAGVADKWGLHADVVQAFGPLMDFSEQSEMGGLSQKILQAVTAKTMPAAADKIRPEARNDFRDWAAIDAFARQFARLVRERGGNR